MSAALESGDRVEVRGMNGQVLCTGTVEEAGVGFASVRPDGKAKVKRYPLGRVRRMERAAVPEPRKALAPPPIARRVTTTRPELRPQPKPPGPYRSPGYLAFVRMQPCASCRSTKRIEAHHWGTDRGISQKVDDTRTVPLCRRCHDHAHGCLPNLDALATRLMILDRQVALLTAYTRLQAEGAAA